MNTLTPPDRRPLSGFARPLAIAKFLAAVWLLSVTTVSAQNVNVIRPPGGALSIQSDSGGGLIVTNISTTGATNIIQAIAGKQAALGFTAGNVANPLSQFASTTSPQFAGVISDETGTGLVVMNSDPVILRPANALGALAIDVTKISNTKTASGNHTWTFSAAGSDGQVFGLHLTGHSADTTQTLPANCYSLALGATLSTFTLKANAVLELSFIKLGSTYYVTGDPVTVNDLTTATPVTGDYLMFHDVSTGIDSKATIANILALLTTITGNAGTATALQTARAIYGNNFDGTAALTQIIASTYGGTGNGFTKFSGPTTTEKTITIPDANLTITAAAATVLDDTTVGAMVDTLGGASASGTGGLTRRDNPVFTTKITLPSAAGTSTLSASGETALNTTDKQIGIHNGTKEVAIPLTRRFPFSFDPKAVCDGAVDRLFLFTVTEPKGITITSWRLSFEADPTTEVDLDLKRADAFIGVANSAVMDVLDTTNGASSESTASNINSGAVVANGKVVYLEFGTAYTETTHQIIFEIEYEIEED